MTPQALKQNMIESLEALKAIDIRSFDVRGLTPLTDFMIIATGRSDRHVKALAENVVTRAKELGYPPRGIEGKDVGEWVLVDLTDVVVHVMQSATRAHYQLEKLWDEIDQDDEQSTGGPGN